MAVFKGWAAVKTLEDEGGHLWLRLKVISLKTKLCYGTQMFSSLLSWRPNLNRRYSLPLSWLQSLGEESEVFPATALGEEVFFLWEKIGEIVGFTPMLMAEACWSHNRILSTTWPSFHASHAPGMAQKCTAGGWKRVDILGIFCAVTWKRRLWSDGFVNKHQKLWTYVYKLVHSLSCEGDTTLVLQAYLKSDVLFIRLIGWQGSFIPTYSIYGTLQSQCTDWNTICTCNMYILTYTHTLTFTFMGRFLG